MHLYTGYAWTMCRRVGTIASCQAVSINTHAGIVIIVHNCFFAVLMWKDFSDFIRLFKT